MGERKKFIRRIALITGSMAIGGIVTGVVTIRILKGPSVPIAVYAAPIGGVLIGCTIVFPLACLWALLFVRDDHSAN